MTDAQTTAARVVAAIDQGLMPTDLFASDAVLWHNYDDEDVLLAGSVAALIRNRAVIPDFGFTDVTTHAVGAGVSLAQYKIGGTLPNGESCRVPAALVVHEGPTGVHRIEEYLDFSQLSPLVAALR